MIPKPDPVAPGQESVWAYPRPAIAERTRARILIEHGGTIVADTRAGIRTLETSHPPNYYIPREDIAPGMLRLADGSSHCEWKGAAAYWDIVVSDIILPRAGWSYPYPTQAFSVLSDCIAFYAGPFDRCSVDGEAVVSQAGHFYGGWITSKVAGPFKGGPGTNGW